MAVERDAITALAREIFRTSRLHLALLGAFTDTATFKRMLKV